MIRVQEILIPRQTVISKETTTDAARSCVRIFQWTSGKVRLTSREYDNPKNIISNDNSRLISPSPVSNSNYVSPTRTGNQDIVSPSHPSIAKRGRNAEPFDASINGFSAINEHSTSYLIGVSGLETVSAEVADVNQRERMNFASNSVSDKTPKFVDLGISSTHKTNKLKSVISPTNMDGGLTDNSDWIAPMYSISEVTEVKVSKVQA